MLSRADLVLWMVSREAGPGEGRAPRSLQTSEAAAPGGRSGTFPGLSAGLSSKRGMMFGISHFYLTIFLLCIKRINLDNVHKALYQEM